MPPKINEEQKSLTLRYRVFASLYVAVWRIQQQQQQQKASPKLLTARLTSMSMMKFHWLSQLGARNAREIEKFRYFDQ